jgi:Tfp pilus assembly protein PilF
MGGMSFARLPRDENEHRLRMREQPNSAEVLTNFGAYLAERPGRAQEAIALCRRALAIDPSYANAQRNLGSLLWREGDLDETERLYRAAAASDPNSIYLGNLAQFLWCERQDVAQAQQYFQRAVDTQPTDGDARSKYLLFLAELGQVEEADRHLQVLLDREDHLDAHPLTRIAQYFERSADDYQQAETFYGKAIARDEGDIFALTQYAGFLLACNNIAASAHRFQQALEANPTDPELQAAVASSFTLLGQNPAKAERLFQQAIAAGVDPNVRANFAQYLILQDRDNEAIAELQELASTDLRHDARVKVLFYEYAHYPDDFPDALNELRRVPQLEGASRRWSFDRNVDRLRLKDEERSGFVSALADVLTGKQAVERLSEYSEWLR